MKIYKFGLIGCGIIAQIHAKAIREMPGALLYGVFDPNNKSAQMFAFRNQCRIYPTLEDMLGDDDIDIVTICTPSNTHAEIAIAAAESGKHVVVEKPLAINEEDARAVVFRQRKTKVKICVISQLRFSPGVQSLRDAILAGQLGDVIIGSLSMRYYRSEEYYKNSGWRGHWATDGGGALMNQGIHGLDLLNYICGPVVSARAVYKTLKHSIEVEDTLCAILEYQNGALGTVEVSTAVRPGSPRRIEIGGTMGRAVLTEDTITEWNADTPVPVKGERWKMNAANNPSEIDIKGHLYQLTNLIHAIEGRDDLLVDAVAGCRSVELVLGIYESARTGKTVYFEAGDQFI